MAARVRNSPSPVVLPSNSARRCRGARWPAQRAGYRTPASTATPPSCPGVPPTTWPRYHRWWRARATSPTCARRGTRSTPTRRSRRRTSCSPCRPPSTRARALTVEAAHLAGLPRLRLLEEPQAAFHDWLFRHRDRLADELAGSRLVLVCDVGGGTTDLTLIQVEPAADGSGPPRLTRIGVGDHLMLGGDNMDLALAHLVEQRLGAGGEGRAERLSAARLSQLVQRCRVAKEQLLAADAPDKVTVTLLGAGSRLIDGARSVELGRDEVERLIVDGFLPLGGPDALPQRRRAAIVEFGLPYPADPAISRHLAAFLQRHAKVARAALGLPAGADADAGANAKADITATDGADTPRAIPDTLLLNGGVFRANALSARLETLLTQWRGAPLRVL
ncbi:MAG TPA: Hsp70 family protein, partial [Thauera sp.]|nr:Hsp70 family protein [Thauera sp.]